MKNAEMSRRIRRQYQQILAGEGEPWYWRAQTTPEVNAWAALFFIRSHGRLKGVDFNRLQNMVVRHGTADCVYFWARKVPGANIKKCQSRIMAVGTAAQMRTFAMNVPGAHTSSIENLAIIKEVLSL